MILFHHIIQIFALSEPTGLWEGVIMLEGLEGRWVGGVLVHSDRAWKRRMTGAQHLPEESFGGAGVTGGAQHEVQRGPRRVDGPVERMPLLLDLDVRFIHAVRIVGRSQRGPAAFLQFRGIALHPAKHGRMIDGDASFTQEFFDITVAEGIAEVPPHRAKDDLSFKVTPFEQGRIMHGRSPVTVGPQRMAPCIRSPAILATEPPRVPADP
jgi:hypothetical protein